MKKTEKQVINNKIYSCAQRYAKAKARKYKDESLTWAFHDGYVAGMKAGHDGKGK